MNRGSRTRPQVTLVRSCSCSEPANTVSQVSLFIPRNRQLNLHLSVHRPDTEHGDTHLLQLPPSSASVWLTVRTGSQYSSALYLCVANPTQNNAELVSDFIQPPVTHWGFQILPDLNHNMSSSAEQRSQLALRVLVHIKYDGGVAEPTTVSVAERYHQQPGGNCKRCRLCQAGSSVRHFVLPLLVSHALALWDCIRCFGKKAQQGLSRYQNYTNVTPREELTGCSLRMTPIRSYRNSNRFPICSFNSYLWWGQYCTTLLHKDIDKYSWIRSHNTEKGSIILPE